MLTRSLPTPAGNIVEITLATVVRPIMLYCSGGEAISFGKQLQQEGRQAATGLVLPPSTNGKGVLLQKDDTAPD